MTRAASAAIALALVGTGLAAVLASRGRDERARCGPGFLSVGPRCRLDRPRAAGASLACAPPLVAIGARCAAPDLHVLVPDVTFALAPSDWEAADAVGPRTVHVASFRIDAFEVTRGAWRAPRPSESRAPSTPDGVDGSLPSAPAAESVASLAPATPDDAESLRAMSGVTRDEAAAFCIQRGGELPTEEQWIAAAGAAGAPAPPASGPPEPRLRRYPWGDTGAVCRRGAWGLARGPCAWSGTGSDTVGAHPDGDAPLGIHDLAGNVAEWVAAGTDPATGVAKGGSWASALASELRVWARLELDPRRADPRVGFRCAYPP